MLGAVSARSASGDRILVVLEPAVEKDHFSKFWASLQGFSSALSPKSIIESQFKGLNTLYLLSSQLGETQRQHFREYDLEFTSSDQALIDAFSYVKGESPATVLLLPAQCAVRSGAVLSDTTLTGGPIVFPSGTVHSAGLNPYLIDVLYAPNTAYVEQGKLLSADEAEVEKAIGEKKNLDTVLTGKKASLVSAFQTRDNARAGFVGSGDVFSDKYWDEIVETADGKKVAAGNAAFATDFTKWVFQETGVVKVISSTHSREGEFQPRSLYTKKDSITYSLTLAQHISTGNDTSWGPFRADDISMDFTMLDPYIRTAMVEDPTDSRKDATTYKAQFIAPDQHGVFKFVVEYWRPGWSFVRTSSSASVVPLRHDEFPRFITGAWPYYTAAINTSVTFLLFCVIWVSLGETDKDRKGKKKAE
ncbi:uncharacterized protein L203_104566 [Cryptococcus depauperatus CBS 7841]|uniref:Dolichyl-diphosphooligosaccharide--protein glycosyltransferase subunit WBP1 n=1 Tax=Cryptococcus depauperatus CBS 7841 TaxID=1295531 RepID=A0AAJ8JVQ2_9TREE